MKSKKLVSVLLASTLVLSCAACGGKDNSNNSNNSNSNNSTGGVANSGDSSQGGTGASSEDSIVVWTLSNDLIDFGERFEEQTGTHVEVIVTEPANYPTKVQTALLAGEKEPDIIVGEPQMLGDFYDAEFFVDLNTFGVQDYKDQIVDYVWDVGQDSAGIQRALAYQITPAGFYYRRDIAQEVFGTDDPDEIGKLFADYPTILETAKTLKSKGYRIFASDSELQYFSGDSAWVVDGVLNVSEGRLAYMDLVVELYKQDLTAYANQWSTPWYQAMAGQVPILTADIQNNADDSVNVWDAEQFAEATANMDKTEVFAFGLPSWGVLVMRDHVEGTSGKWGVCAGPTYGFGGGTYIGISSRSEKQDKAWEFVKFCTLNEDTAEWWIEFSQGDTIALLPVLEKHKDDGNDIYGGQKLYAFWLQQAEGIDYSKVTRYDQGIGDAWGKAISNIKTGVMTKEQAISEFYDTIEATYLDITVKR